MVHALVVEDSPTHHDFFIFALTFKGHTAKGAFNGQQGLEVLAQKDKIDIIFCDYHMPIMNGYDFSRIVKTDPKYVKHSKVPIIGVGDFPEDKREYLVECVSKTSLKITDIYKWIDQYCK